ncbi:hypothetical protein EON63_23650 [archaeon]|nr:MAG: hypothetical protein EON63_23650 [archaeon]
MPRQGAARYFDTSLSIPQHDLIIFMGDLNYRIDDTIPTDLVFSKCTPTLLHTLLPHDQLNIERSKQRVFVGFEEGAITFLPTYKYQPNTDVYETRAEKKLRAPAWCDRVLYRYTHLITTSTPTSTPIPPIRLGEYSRANLTPSDHKPVYASFGVSVKQVVEFKENNVYTELLGVLSRLVMCVMCLCMHMIEVYILYENLEVCVCVCLCIWLIVCTFVYGYKAHFV